jgi:hypothetical protein
MSSNQYSKAKKNAKSKALISVGYWMDKKPPILYCSSERVSQCPHVKYKPQEEGVKGKSHEKVGEIRVWDGIVFRP